MMSYRIYKTAALSMKALWFDCRASLAIDTCFPAGVRGGWHIPVMTTGASFLIDRSGGRMVLF